MKNWSPNYAKWGKNNNVISQPFFNIFKFCKKVKLSANPELSDTHTLADHR